MTSSSRHVQIDKLEAARHDAIVKLGVGGYVEAKDFCRVFNDIDADCFANIMYATERMLHDFEGEECINPDNIPLMIAKYDFDQKHHFKQVSDIFRTYFGKDIARF